MILYTALLVVALAGPVKLGEGMCSDSWVSRYCEKYAWKGRVFIVIFDDGDIYRLVELTEDGEELIYQAPKRFWI